MARERKTGIMTRHRASTFHDLVKVVIKTKYVYLWKIGREKPRRFIAKDFYRKALRNNNWGFFEQLIDGIEAQEDARQQLFLWISQVVK
jgi:hypothetical protein